ncbi:DUF1972 domain-containing protein [uncultured Winogradskyella sp.]|uniref:DUF1972 domain-containing protein n=1 Tax=uncultured Winogradskyella sp. TaxID=395353 RepID=UPI0030DBA21A|tara:strand:+ start:3241 stop:4350 length:1110 start_codon:yes stop_codon:yes gene_type:complete
MKIAIIGIRGLPANYGGFETCADHTSKNWVSTGHDVIVYCRKSHYKTRVKEINGVKLQYINSLPIPGVDTLLHTFFSIIHLIIFRRKYKNVHLYNSGNGIFLPILKFFRKKVIVSVDGIEWKREKWGKMAKTIHKFGAKCAMSFADKIITDNKEVYDFYYKCFGKQTTIITYGAKFIDKTGFKGEYLKKYNLISGEYYIFVGRFVPEKGVHHLIEAYLKLKTKKPLVLVGDDTSDTNYKKDIFSIGEKYSNIILPGFLYNDEYEELLSNAYLYLSASELEGTSPSLLAAMGAKVCALVNGINENLQTIQSSGVWFKKCDYNDLLTKWRICENDSDYINEMANKGYEHARKNYLWQSIAQQYIDLFQEFK